MTGYQVVIDKIRHTGQAAGRVAAGVRGAACSAAVPAGDAGIPGARATGKLAEVKRTLEDRERGFVVTLDGHASDMATAADRYAGQESAAASDITTTPQPTGQVKAV
ncbi:hypothetical protein [Amycolatopsis samaneae]|uniref:Excreted virulence factor EspC, type VII ESX diderm n=1 Tax=Amycolatopsis samaneae TaxID=664691 RepID=A0ABW5GXA7_9PSEU